MELVVLLGGSEAPILEGVLWMLIFRFQNPHMESEFGTKLIRQDQSQMESKHKVLLF